MEHPRMPCDPHPVPFRISHRSRNHNRVAESRRKSIKSLSTIRLKLGYSEELNAGLTIKLGWILS